MTLDGGEEKGEGVLVGKQREPGCEWAPRKADRVGDRLRGG